MLPSIFSALLFLSIAAVILLAKLFKCDSISASPASAVAKLEPVRAINSKRFELAVASLPPLSPPLSCPPTRPLLNLRPLKPIEVSRPAISDDKEVTERFGKLSIKGLDPRSSQRSTTFDVRPQMPVPSQPTTVIATDTTASLEKLSITEPAPRSRTKKADPTRRKRQDAKLVDNGVDSIVSSLKGLDLDFDTLLSGFEGLSVKDSGPKSCLKSTVSETVRRHKKTVRFTTLPSDCTVVVSELRFVDVDHIRHKVRKEAHRYKYYGKSCTPHVFGRSTPFVYNGKLCLMKEFGTFNPPSYECEGSPRCKITRLGYECEHCQASS